MGKIFEISIKENFLSYQFTINKWLNAAQELVFYAYCINPKAFYIMYAKHYLDQKYSYATAITRKKRSTLPQL